MNVPRGVTDVERAHDTFLRRFRWEAGHADVWRAFDDPDVFACVVAALVAPWRGRGVSKVCAIEARGFVLGGACAIALGAGFVAVRKAGSLFPGPKLRVDTTPDYRGRRHVLELRRDSLDATDRVLLVDDWIERGSQAIAARLLIERCGAELDGITVLVDQLDDRVRSALPVVTSIVTARELPETSRR